MMYAIEEICTARPFSLGLRFNTGETIEVDLESRLKEWSQSAGSSYKTLLDPDYFVQVKLDPEMETIHWENGIDFCPDTLYQWGIQQL